MNKKELYTNYISKLEEALVSDDFDSLDYILEAIYSNNMPEADLEAMDDILQEATLYIELKEQEYKEEALRLIEEFKG
ncbi:MAG: hypothetical protein PHH06_05210 [Candidatus Gracilibacteria bacterium]|nr:hypothetical protein [Candidatus Gracilibacteria bacterium]